MIKIMIVEDDKSISAELKELLENSGYEVLILQDFKNALNEILGNVPDLLLLDINIPYINGELLLQNIRKTLNIPIIMVTSKDSETDEALSFSYGADDYITKPYNPNILLLRIGAVLKRVNETSSIFTYRDLKINTQRGVIIKGDRELVLTKNEMIIFACLLASQNKIVSRDELMTNLWNNDEFINDNALTVNISRLRTKLKSIGYSDVIDTRKNQGYILL